MTINNLKKINIIFVSLFIIFGNSPVNSYSIEMNIGYAHYEMIEFKKNVELIILGKKLDPKIRKKIKGKKIYGCKRAKDYFIKIEKGKLLYNDLFKELKSKKQIDDIKKYSQDIEEAGNNCMKLLKLWNEYDNKWYRASREKDWFEQKELEKTFINKSPKENGDEYWDGYLGETLVRVPRKDFRGGSSKIDGAKFGLNLNLKYENYKYDPDNIREGFSNKQDQITGYYTNASSYIMPCSGFGEDIKECTSKSSQTGFVSRHLNCSNSGYGGSPNPEKVIGERYRARWRKECKYKSGFENDYKPIYDEEVGMMSIGDRGFYEGEAEFPTYWLSCSKIPKDSKVKYKGAGRSLCQSAIEVDGTYLQYNFPHHLFWEHKKIHEYVRNKLEEYVIKNKKNKQIKEK